MIKAVERYFAAWTELDLDTVRKAWVKAAPSLGALQQHYTCCAL